MLQTNIHHTITSISIPLPHMHLHINEMTIHTSNCKQITFYHHKDKLTQSMTAGDQRQHPTCIPDADTNTHIIQQTVSNIDTTNIQSSHDSPSDDNDFPDFTDFTDSSTPTNDAHNIPPPPPQPTKAVLTVPGNTVLPPSPLSPIHMPT